MTRSSPSLPRAVVLAAVTALAVACGGPARPDRTVHIDSILPIDEELRRFREALGPTPRALDGGAPGLDSLGAALAAAVNAGDRSAFARLALDRAEFAWFHYPYTPLPRPPYELGPALAWFQLVRESNAGMARLLRVFEGGRVEVGEVQCDQPPRSAGAGRLHRGCTTSVRAADGAWVDVRLFGDVLERDGRFKVVTWWNEL